MKRVKLAWVGMSCAIVGLAAVHLQAQQTFNGIYDFRNVTTSSGTSDPTPTPVAAGVVFGSFQAVGYNGSPNASGRFSWTSSETGGVNGEDNFDNFGGSLNPAKYFEVTLAPEAAYTLNLDDVSFAVRRSGSGIRSYAVRSSLDAFAANLPASISPANTNLGVGPDNSFRWLFDATSTSADQLGSRLALGSSFTAVSAPVTFRFYGWNAESSAGTFSMDDVVFSGSVAPVPEPAATALLPLGAWLWWAQCRRVTKAGTAGKRQERLHLLERFNSQHR